MKISKTDQYVAIESLKGLGVKPGSTIYCSVSHVARSGMSRRAFFYVVYKRDIICISGYLANALGYRRDFKYGGVILTGCGMDLGFHAVYSLGRVMFPKGGNAKRSVRAGRILTARETDGGYLLRSQWI